MRRMKINRQLAIITYLLNRDVVTGKHLAEKFEVTERTIQRDIDCISMAGIPITSIRGVNGGYKILDTYHLSKQTTTSDDLAFLRMALESLHSVIDNRQIVGSLEKVKSLQATEQATNISIDFSVAKENKKVVKYLGVIDEAIANKRCVQFQYMKANLKVTNRVIEPVGLKYKWYGWYLVGYCTDKHDYRIFKLSRMEKLKQHHRVYDSTRHKKDYDLFDALMEQDERKPIKVRFKFHKSIHIPVTEYLNGVRIIEEEENYYMAELHIIESERMWFGAMLSFGSQLEILEPTSIRQQFYDHAREIINTYKIPDN